MTEYVHGERLDDIYGVIVGATGLGTLRYVHRDLLGNVVGVSQAGTIYDKRSYSPWGAVTYGSVSMRDTLRVGWKGMFWEGDVGLAYARSRWYDPVAGRFISEDPIGMSDGVNRYLFGHNDPVNHRDGIGLASVARNNDDCLYIAKLDGGYGAEACLPDWRWKWANKACQAAMREFGVNLGFDAFAALKIVQGIRKLREANRLIARMKRQHFDFAVVRRDRPQVAELRKAGHKQIWQGSGAYAGGTVIQGDAESFVNMVHHVEDLLVEGEWNFEWQDTRWMPWIASFFYFNDMLDACIEWND